MTIYFNVTDAVSSQSQHGITRTERRLAVALAAHPQVEFVRLSDGRLWRTEREHVLPKLSSGHASSTPHVEVFGVDRSAGGAGTSTSIAASVRQSFGTIRRSSMSTPSVPLRRLLAGDDDVLVSVGMDWIHGLLPEASRFVFGSGGRFVGCCYDMIPIDHPEWIFPPNQTQFLHHYAWLTEIASTVLCISERTRADFQSHFPQYERTSLLPLGADAAVAADQRHHRFAETLFDGAPFAVYCATLDRRKNHQLLYRALKELARRGQTANLVFVGKIGSGVGDLVDALRHDTAVAGRIAHVTDCDDGYLSAIYRRATFAVYPSLYEGWGLGVTEALMHGTPCLVASGSSLGEAGLGSCRELHPLKTRDWADAMEEYYATPPSLPVLPFPTWEDSARALLSVIDSVGWMLP